MTRPTLLFAHERRSIARAVERVLATAGFDVHYVTDGVAARELLESHHFSGLVVDVALPGVPGFELCAIAKDPARPDRGADVVVLVASVYRRTSYKRRPTRLYGADDYVEVHHLCDSLPEKLFAHLGIPEPEPALGEQARSREELRIEGDARMVDTDYGSLATLIVADMVLYNGDAIFAANSLAQAAAALTTDLDIARQLYAQVEQAEGRAPPQGDPIGEAFAALMITLGRARPGESLQEKPP